MKTTTFKMIGAGAVLAAAIASVSAFAHKPEQQGMGMMGEHMETMGGMMGMMSGMSAEDRSKMQAEPTLVNGVSGKTDHAITVYKSPNCSCCADWAEHLESNGFEVNIENTSNINEIKTQHQIPRDMASCHTGIIDGVVIEGHVPADDIKAYLKSRSQPFGDKILGLAVPGMPHGTPGMETGRQDNYDVMAFTADGKAQSVKRYEF